MRLRIIILVLAILAFLSASAGGFLYYYSLRQAAYHQAEHHARTRLELFNRQLTSFLSEHVRPVKALSGLGEIRHVLESHTQETMKQANGVLDNFAKSLNLEACYLMNVSGITIASSNRMDPDSFVGRDFSFRPYFTKAVSGYPATYLALGTTSRKRGVYYSHPVYSIKDDDKIVGIAVIKTSVELIESKLFAGSDGLLLVTDPNGVIFIANKKEMRFMILWRPSKKTIERIKNSRQFGDGPWLWSGFFNKEGGEVADKNKEKYLYAEMGLESYPGWQIIHLRSWKDIGRHLADPFIKIIGPVIIVISFLIGVAVFILYNKALHEIIRRRQVEKKLRLSEERYRHIYHKTPVMLHSIDTAGTIIRVSDFWLEKMGYERHEVIGKNLTSFYTPASREYAEKVIFPVFFTTGFCEDVPYTYVNKTGELIDILLSCYGVRDEDGNVVRSLAVSVDVTEKNQVQRDLEAAKEKLSRYSMDLEQQVEKRTAELRKVQDQLRRLSGKIMTAHENERRAVARELHDHLGQMLTALRMDAVWIEKNEALSDVRVSSRAGRICSLIDETIEDVREMAFRLRPGVLDDLGLVDALELLTRDFENRSDVSCIFRHEDIPCIDDTIATALYRIAQEAVTNALRHSGASDIDVSLVVEQESLLLRIRDNGCGFVSDGNTEYEGLGLTGMKERATLAGGTLNIFSEKGRGTEIICNIKLGDKND